MQLEELTQKLVELTQITPEQSTRIQKKLLELQEAKPEAYKGIEETVELYETKLVEIKKELNEGKIEGKINGTDYYPVIKEKNACKKMQNGLLYILNTPVRICDTIGDKYRNFEDKMAFRKNFFGKRREKRKLVDYLTGFLVSGLALSETCALIGYGIGAEPEIFGYSLLGAPILLGIQFAKDLHEAENEEKNKKEKTKKLSANPAVQHSNKLAQYKVALDFKLQVQKINI